VKLTRRRALAILGGAVAAGAAYLLLKSLLFPPKREAAGPRERKPNPYVSEGKPLVAVAEGGSGGELVERALKALGGLDRLIKGGERVVIKPNVGFPYLEAVASPEVVARLVELAYEAGAGEVIVAESSVRGSDTTYCYERTGVKAAAEKADSLCDRACPSGLHPPR